VPAAVAVASAVVEAAVAVAAAAEAAAVEAVSEVDPKHFRCHMLQMLRTLMLLKQMFARRLT
jgi:hypothetical protein